MNDINTTNTADKKRTITLTGRPPVTISESAWPVIASASERPGSFRNGTPVPDSETDSHTIRVRQHADGRVIVYAILVGATVWTGTEDHRGGVVVAAVQNPAKPTGVMMTDMRRVADAIHQVGEECGILARVIRDCIADLPAEEI